MGEVKKQRPEETSRIIRVNPCIFWVYLQRLFCYLFIVVINCYRKWISPCLPARCRYVPTCSEYALDAFKRFGIFGGIKLTVKRLLRCQPFGGCGYDPVPKKHQAKSAESHSLD